MNQSDKTWAWWFTVPFFTALVTWLLTHNVYGALGGFTGTLLVSVYQAIRLRRQSSAVTSNSPRGKRM